MARRRYQNPEPHKKGKFWWLLVWKDEVVNGKLTRKRRRIKLAPVTMPKREVQKVAAEQVHPMNQGLVTLGSAINFDEYVDSIYRVNNLPLMAASTRERYDGVIKNYLAPDIWRAVLARSHAGQPSEVFLRSAWRSQP